MYAEQLAWELDFEKDPYANLGRLRAELFDRYQLPWGCGAPPEGEAPHPRAGSRGVSGAQR